MIKALNPREIDVLQENLDLFASPATTTETPSSPSATTKPAARPRRRTKPKRPNPPATPYYPEPEQLPIEESVSSNGAGQQIIGIRATSSTKAKEWLQQEGITVENYTMEKRDPALRNLSEALLDLGVANSRDGKLLHWFLVNSPRDSHELTESEPIEIAFTTKWFEQQKSAIRRLKGADYIDACQALARQVTQPPVPAP